MLQDPKQREVDPKVTEEAQKLIDEGWHQTSRAYCMLGRLPTGKTGIQALIEAELASRNGRKDASVWAAKMGEHHAGDHFLRMYANGGLKKTVSSQVMDEFRRLGGGTFMQSRLPPMLRRVRELSKQLEWKSDWSYDLGISKGWADALELFTRLFEHSDFRIESDQATRFNEESMRAIDYHGRAAVAFAQRDPKLQGVCHEQEDGKAVLPANTTGAVQVAVSEERGSGDQPEEERVD